MTVKTQMPIVIFRGDNTAAFDLRTIRILLTGDLDLSHATAKFTLLDFSKTWTEQEVATGELSIVFTAEQTKAFALGPQTGTLRLYDMSTGTPRQLTIVNKIPFFVTNRVCEIDSQSYGADVCVSGGDVIHIEFKVGAGAVEGKADKVKNATAGDLASLTADGNLEDSGIPKTDVQRKLAFDSTPTAGSQNPVTSDGIKRAIDAATPSDYDELKAQVQVNTGDIAEIEGMIPAQASSSNKLADKNFVNSSIQTNTATFRGTYNLVSDLGLTTSATEQQVAAAIATKLASLQPPVVPENNDYVFVQVPKTSAEPTVIERVDRYKCTVTESGGVTTRVWGYEWSLNNSSFTADQWVAINSGITSGLVEKLDGIEAGAQVNAIQTVKVNSVALTPDASKAVDVTVPTELNDVCPDVENWLGVPGTTAAGKYIKVLAKEVNGVIEGGVTVTGSSNNDNNTTKYRYGGVTVTRNGAAAEYLFDGSQSGIARFADIYAAVQQIAPAWVSGTAYTQDTLVSYNGAVYRCKADTVSPHTATPDTDTTHWEAKPVSELFLPLTGGAMTGPIAFANDLYEIQSPPKMSLLYADDHWNFVDHMGNIISTQDYRDGVLAFLSDVMRFSSLSSYAVGDVVFYSGSFYRCTTAHSAGVWNASHFAEVLGLSTVANNVVYPTAPTPTAGDDSTKIATTAFVKTAVDGVPLRYDMPTSVALVATNDEATLVCADRAVTNATIATGFSTLNLTFPTAVSGKVRDFYLRITVAAGESAPALSIPQGITIENPDGAVPEIADGETSAASTTLVWFSETAPNVFTAKAETVKAVA